MPVAIDRQTSINPWAVMSGIVSVAMQNRAADPTAGWIHANVAATTAGTPADAFRPKTVPRSLCLQ